MPLSQRLLFFLTILFSGCARTHFYQETAITNPTVRAEILSGKTPDSVTVTVGRHYDKNGLQCLFFGKHYRELWATPVNLPVFDINNNAFGNLKPVSIGGGFQTTSLTLKDNSNWLFVLRSLDKDPQKTLPKPLRKTFIVNVIRDQTSAANPYAPLVLPTLSHAAGIFYSSPKLFYVTENNSSFGSFSERLDGKVMLLEEKFDGKNSLTPMFGNAINLVNSEEMLKARFDDNHHLIDQDFFARNRLFDMLIGDWDRHEGQWQWAVYKNGADYIYKPIPKDRDQTFYRFDDGIITWLASRRFILKKFQTFRHHYGNISGWLFNARFIDARALNEVTKETWLQHADEMKAALTDEVIAEAFSKLPKLIYQKTAEQTMRRLRSRRDLLPQAALTTYAILAKEVTIAGTDLKEKFVIERLPSGETKVQVFRTETIESKSFYSRTFKPSETKKIIIHGLGGNDDFEISGKANRAIKMELFGGEGEDEINDTSKVGGLCKKTTAYDTKRGLILENTHEIKKKLYRNVAINAYDREGL